MVVVVIDLVYVVYVTYGCALHWQHFSMLCTSDLVDDVSFAHNGQEWAMQKYIHPFNGPLSRTTRVCRYQKGKTSLDFTEARDSEWQWHQLGHMQVCTSLQTDKYASTPPLIFYRPDALPAAQPTVSKH